MKPTQEQVRKFWEWCGFKPITHAQMYPNVSTNFPDEIDGWGSPDGDKGYHLPDIDLNNLFKYAVPKLEYWSLSKTFSNYRPEPVFVSIQDKQSIHFSNKWDYDPALTLFWAIWEVIKDG